jgi:two-component system copper resistance phosphate regulon response regulator CusR
MRILFVEDDKQLRNTVARGLREAEHQVDLAINGTQAMTMATGPGAAGRYDAIVLDILLPGPDGIAICAAIREEGNSVPILMLTALDAVEHRIRGLDAGADDYLTKPFDFGELLARLRALTRRHEPGEARLKVGDLTIDVARKRARRGKRDIPLSDRELALLTYLARRPGEVVSRAELMAQVWEDESGSYSNIVDVYASRVRRKIDDDEAVSLFKTLRGTGYMLEAPPAATRHARGAGRSRR